jgi:hypothetical protein
MSAKKARILFFSFLVSLTGFLGFIPGYNGDMPFYIATAMNFEGKTDQQAISVTRELIQSELKSEKTVLHLYNIDHSSPGVLNYYRIKPLYILLIIFFHAIGFSYIAASLIPSLTSFFLIGWTAFLWSSKKFKPEVALFISALFMLTNPSIVLARLSTPDALSNLFILVSIYRIYFGKKYLWTVMLLMTSLFIRLDNFISAGILLTLMHFWPDGREKTKMPLLVYLLFLLFAGALCLFVNYYFTSGFWWFRHFEYVLSIHAYFFQVLIYFSSFSSSMIALLVLITFFAFLNWPGEIPGKIIYLITAVYCIIFVRFLFFPSLEERFMTAFELCILLSVLELFKREKILKTELA